MKDTPFRWMVLFGALGSATCCPSLFLTVTKGDPGPHPAMPAPKPSAVPLLVPAGLDNRFDVLNRNARPSDYADFDDVTRGSRAVTSLQALERIKQNFGVPGAPDLATTSANVPACVVCTGSSCEQLLFPGTPFPTDRPVVLIPQAPHSQVGRMVTLAAPVHGNAEVIAGCDPHPGDTLAILDGAMGGVAPFERLMVTVAFPGMETITAFIHVSDVQIRDPDIRVGDRVLSRHLDKLISSFEYDPDLEFYNRYAVEALFATINQMHKTMPELRFVIHTGDAIDSGVTTELRAFHRLYDSLDLPAYNLLGNHDVLTFGNLLATKTATDGTCITAKSEAVSGYPRLAPITWLIPNKICIRSEISCPSCLPGEAQFVAGTSHEESHANFMREFKMHAPADELAEPPGRVAGEPAEYCPSVVENGQEVEHPIQIQTTTLQHGFDLNRVPGAKDPPGYYAFANDISVAGEPRHALFIALDTNDLDRDEGGQVGRIKTKQLTWLRATLRCVASRHAKDLVFVLGHHGLSDVHVPDGEGQSVESILASSKNVVGYFYGHEHQHGICRHPGSCQHFWEVMTGSVIEFPQEARLVRVKYAGKGLGFIEVVTFGERIENGGDQFGLFVELAHRGARRDYCANHDASACSDDQRPYRDDARHTNARLFFKLPEYK